jgi:DNA-directed RNA polymerase specialized sigma24 family protein
MCAAIFESRILDGIRHQLLGSSWFRLGEDAADDVVADALDELVNKMIESGGSVQSLGGMLWRIAQRRSLDRIRLASRHVPLVEDLEDPGQEPDLRRNEFDDEAAHEARVREALAAARSLLPRLGNTTIERVMSYYFDAVERGDDHVGDEEIASAFGFTRAQVRMARSRGFVRLERAAREIGLAASLDLPGRRADDSDETEGSDE